VGLGAAYPDKNFIGVDIKGNRIWKGSQQAISAGLKNVAFLRTFIQNIETFFAPQEVSEIWITFPDPRPKGRDEKRRLTHERFLQSYFRLLKPGGIIHLKTDHTGFYEYTLEVLEALGITPLAATHDLYASPFANDHLGIKTHYEGLWTAKGSVIKYLRFQFHEHPVLPEGWECSPYPPVIGSTRSY
jgi:tRNA (guanine-N7-)-methyltransferase